MNQSFPNKSLAGHQGEGLCCQGGAQQGTGARGEQYLDSTALRPTLAARICLESRPLTILSNTRPFFRSKPKKTDYDYEDDDEDDGEPHGS